MANGQLKNPQSKKIPNQSLRTNANKGKELSTENYKKVELNVNTKMNAPSTEKESILQN